MAEPNLAEVAAQLGVAPSPQLQLIAQLLAQRAERTQDEEQEQQRAERDAADPAVARLSRRERRAFEFLRDMNQELARACGACVCWGRRPSCPHCQGRGSAGFTDADPLLFRRHVEPVLLRMGLVREDREPKHTARRERG
jgi:hypothetical protein